MGIAILQPDLPEKYKGRRVVLAAGAEGTILRGARSYAVVRLVSGEILKALWADLTLV